MLFATAVCDVTKNWLLESMARADTLSKVRGGMGLVPWMWCPHGS